MNRIPAALITAGCASLATWEATSPSQPPGNA